MPDVWPEGSPVVFLDRGLTQIDVPLSARGVTRVYRIGVAQRGYDDPSVVARTEAFNGIGLRPYRPAHLRARSVSSGDIAVSWVRRTRIDGDGWQFADVPLSEEREAYQLRILDGATVRRNVVLSVPSWTYGFSDRVADGTISGCRIEVAQLSERFGPGPFATVRIGN
jgi:hypothetical protein